MSPVTPVIVATREEEVVEVVRDARVAGTRIAIRGQGSLFDRLGGPSDGVSLLTTSGLRGVVAHVPEDLIITVRAGTPLTELKAVLASAGQECPIEPDPAALDGDEASGTVGGRLASALAGPRQLDAGRVRDWVLRVRFVAGDGSLITYGGVTVKDVTGYDLSRLMVGSWGSLGVLTEVTLKVRPIARSGGWHVTDAADTDPIARLHRPAGVFRAVERMWVRLEGHPDDVAADVAALGLRASTAPVLPCTARLAVDPPLLAGVVRTARDAGATVVTQEGVGVAHLGGDVSAIMVARAAVEAAGGALLVMDPILGLDAFGGARTLGRMALRVADALDPDGVFAGRWDR